MTLEKKDMRVIMEGLFPIGQDVRLLPQAGKEEIRAAVKKLLDFYDYDNARLAVVLQELEETKAEILRLREELRKEQCSKEAVTISNRKPGQSEHTEGP